MELPSKNFRQKSLALLDKGLVGYFTGMWPSPKTIEYWIQKTWRGLVQGNIDFVLVEKYFSFSFSAQEKIYIPMLSKGKVQ